VAKPDVNQLLIDSALQPDLRRRLLETPDEVFPEFELTEEERDILRNPDHRLLTLLGAALARQVKSADLVEPARVKPPAPANPTIEARTLPDTLLALTVIPCALLENGEPTGISYVVLVNPLAEGSDPANLPLPPPDELPGRALTPLHAVIQLSAVDCPDATGNPQIGLWASFRRSTNVFPPPPAETAGVPSASPFGSALDTPEVEAAVAAVRQCSREERYDRLADLLHVLHSGDVR
jgi:hypothetical protein